MICSRSYKSRLKVANRRRAECFGAVSRRLTGSLEEPGIVANMWSGIRRGAGSDGGRLGLLRSFGSVTCLQTSLLAELALSKTGNKEKRIFQSTGG